MNVSFQSLLSATWRKDEHIHLFGTLDRKTGQFRHHLVRDLARAGELAAELSRGGVDVYFAPAAFGTAHNRTAANAIGSYSFCMDVDCGAEKAASGKGYLDLAHAIKASADFASQTDLPEPTAITCSGNGIQVYWCVDSMVLRPQWELQAQRLKDLCAATGFLVDPARTSDIASVMRLPGTLNHKQEPAKPAYIIEGPIPPTPTDDFLSAVARAHLRCCPERIGEPAPPVTSASEPAQEAPDLLDVQAIEECLRQLDPDMSRAHWFRVAAVIFHELKGAAIGFALFDEWSKGGRKYSGLASTRALWKSLRHDHPNPAKLVSLLWMAREPSTSRSVRSDSDKSGPGAGGER